LQVSSTAKDAGEEFMILDFRFMNGLDFLIILLITIVAIGQRRRNRQDRWTEGAAHGRADAESCQRVIAQGVPLITMDDLYKLQSGPIQIPRAY
jgi:hypothetical protein